MLSSAKIWLLYCLNRAQILMPEIEVINKELQLFWLSVQNICTCRYLLVNCRKNIVQCKYLPPIKNYKDNIYHIPSMYFSKYFREIWCHFWGGERHTWTSCSRYRCSFSSVNFCSKHRTAKLRTWGSGNEQSSSSRTTSGSKIGHFFSNMYIYNHI